MDRGFLEEFESPGSEYRGKPFWAWNGKLDPDELRRQIRHMHRMGLGGFFMHSRVGLDTAYLSDEWFECVEACADEAEKLDMEAWLYDEDRWPSGAAGGLVTKNPKHRMRSLRLEVLDGPKEFRWERETLAVFTAELSGSAATKVTRVARGKIPRKLGTGEKILAMKVVVNQPSSWYNGYTYLDTLSHEAVREFLKVTHEAYRKRVGKRFGTRIPGIFTDEPNHGGKLRTSSGVPTSAGLPWTDKLPAVFKKRYGYDLVGHLVELYYDVDGKPFTQARYHYHDCVTHLFVDAFGKQIGKWCDKHGIAHTGHLLAEDSLSSQTDVVGDCMRFYEYMQAPGIDLLTEHGRIYDTAKQVSSAAHQFGRKWRLTETYGCTGWDFPFLGHKALGDWQAALGINLRCQHLSWYTMEGQAKRDYPAGIFYQSPWWEAYPRVEDYFARVNAATTRGEEVRDILVIHPVESMWLKVKMGWKGAPETGELDSVIVALRDTLLAANLDFDYGNEVILARHGSVAKRKGVPTLAVAKAAYKAVVVPPMVTMRASTLKLLKRFREAGGVVVFAGEVPAHLDALRSDAVERFAATCARTDARGPSVVEAVEATCRRVSIAGPEGTEINPTLYLLREDKEACYLFVCNTGHDLTGERGQEPMARDRTAAFPDVRITGFGECAGHPLELDPEKGAVHEAQAARTDAGWTISTSLPALGSRLFLIPKQKTDLGARPRKALREVRREELGGSTWDIALSEDNCLVLDRPAYRIGEGTWEGPEEILRVDSKVREALGVARRGGQMVQPWAREKPGGGRTVRVALRYAFGAEALPSGGCCVAVEQPRRFAIALNGTSLDTDAECGWWVDRSLRRIPFDPALLRTGPNELILECDYDADHPGLEIVYLLGRFGTRAQGTEVSITAPPKALELGDWVAQGLTFYSGSVSYLCTIAPTRESGERLFVEVPEYRGVAARVLVNGRSAGVVGWEPNEVEITDLVDGSPVQLAVEVLGHRRNSHGPLHLAEKWPRWTGPAEYITGGDRWVDWYQLVPCGLMKPPALAVKS